MSRGSFVGRMVASSIREAERQRKADIRNAERARKEAIRAQAADEKERKRQYLEDRIAEVQEMNQDLEAQIDALEHLLTGSLAWNPAVDFEGLKVKPTIPKLDLSDLQQTTKPPSWELFEPKRPHPLIGWIPAIRRGHEARVEIRQREHRDALAAHEAKEVERRNACEKRVQEHKELEASIKAEVDRKNAEIDQWRIAIEGCEKEAVESHFDHVLGASPYPDGFPQEAKLAFVKESRQLVVEYELPVIDAIIPTVKNYTYVKASDTINETARPEKQRRSLYASVVAQTALRCLRDVFLADRWGHIDTVVLNGVVPTKDPGTGKPIRPCLVTIRTTRDRFMDLNHAEVDPIAALQHLSASFSKSPAELAPVRPLLEFNMVDPRFIKEVDVMSTLDQRPNLMDLSPGDFESLITNLFQKMGLETRLTQASRDGGVDCVAFDPRPIFGGKVVIQAKRYKNTVGVSAVRDLFGTMQNEGASKGILVATSGYGKASFEFANGKPMELLDGGNLLHLLKEHAGVEAKIVMPDDWKDPV